MKRFLGLQLERHREIPPWAKAMANHDISPWQKESPFPIRNGTDKISKTVLEPSTLEPSTLEPSTLEPVSDRSENLHPNDWQPPGYFTGEDIPRRPPRLLPGHVKNTDKVPELAIPPALNPVRRSWPEPREKNERRIISANYSAVEIHGFFGLIDDGSVGEGRMLIVHVPKWIRGYFLDIKQGDDLHVYHPKGKVKGTLSVLATGRHKYYAPGRRVMTCTVCVSEEQWAPFSQI
jgi:hypothetical protein